MKNFIYTSLQDFNHAPLLERHQNRPVNLNNCTSIETSHYEQKYFDITFLTVVGGIVSWRFKTKKSRDAVYSEILSGFSSEIKPVEIL